MSKSYLVPNVIVKTRDGERGYDIYSRLLEDRIIFLGEDVNEHTANVVVARILGRTPGSTTCPKPSPCKIPS